MPGISEQGMIPDARGQLCGRLPAMLLFGVIICFDSPDAEGVDKLMTSRHLCAIRLHERKTAMP